MRAIRPTPMMYLRQPSNELLCGFLVAVAATRWGLVHLRQVTPKGPAAQEGQSHRPLRTLVGVDCAKAKAVSCPLVSAVIHHGTGRDLRAVQYLSVSFAAHRDSATGAVLATILEGPGRESRSDLPRADAGPAVGRC